MQDHQGEKMKARRTKSGEWWQRKGRESGGKAVCETLVQIRPSGFPEVEGKHC